MPTEQQVGTVRRLSVIVVAMTFVLMVLGSWVKATGSGLACPDWPTCYGGWLPPFPSADNGGVDPDTGRAVVYSQAQILYEWGHRALAMLTGFAALAYAIAAGMTRGLTWAARWLPTVAIGVLMIQVLLGGVTVLGGNAPPLTTAHLMTAVVFFFILVSAMWHTMLRPLEVETAEPPAPERPRTPVADRQPAPGTVRAPLHRAPDRWDALDPGPARFPGEDERG